jgi:L-lactate dehydrogenase complex protein LldG
MSEARDDILAGIRRSLGVSAGDTARRQIVEARIAAATRGILPQRGEGDVATRAATFQAQAESVSASVARVTNEADLPAEIARFLRENNLPATLRMGDDARLTTLPWGATTIEVSTGPSNGDDLNAVSHAAGGVAETGTLVLVSGSHNPTTLNFLPDNHIVVLRAETIAANYESVWTELRKRFGKGLMPRTVNLITGPSRSADIEQKMLLGAHGPRRLHIVIVG